MLDNKDAGIFQERFEAFIKMGGPRIGDHVVFKDGARRRVSYLWGDETFQTSVGGSFYLGDGYISFSGSLYSGVPLATLTRTDEMEDGSVWFFHHDIWKAGNGVDVELPFRVYRCSEPGLIKGRGINE